MSARPWYLASEPICLGARRKRRRQRLRRLQQLKRRHQKRIPVIAERRRLARLLLAERRAHFAATREVFWGPERCAIIESSEEAPTT